MNDKYLLKVNDISDKKNFGITKKIEDIEYNIDLFGQDFKERNEIYNLFVEEGLTSVFSIGRFIVVLQRTKSKKEGEMAFFDFDIDLPVTELKKSLLLKYSESIIEGWFNNYYFLKTEFTEEDDTIELVLS